MKPDLINGKVFTSFEKESAISMAMSFSNVKLVGEGKTKYYNIPCSFDIETSSFYVNKEKHACMYVWQFGINGVVIYGRTWEEFSYFLEYLVNALKLNSNRRLVIYVHNLSYEFAFVSLRLKLNNRSVFAIDRRKVARMLTSDGLEFKCSLILSGFRLETVGKNLLKYKVEKLSGNLDYNLIRNSKTILTRKEFDYCINDVRVVMAYIQELIEDEGEIQNIPLTKTSYPRRYARNKCLYEAYPNDEKRSFLEYRSIMKSLILTSASEYEQLKRAFQGGFVHANICYARKLEKDVSSLDLTSAYPSRMALEMFPMSSATFIGRVSSIEKLTGWFDMFCCIFDIALSNLKPKVMYENIISLSKCTSYSGEVVTNNGRIIRADYIELTLTELHFKMICEYYTFDIVDIWDLRVYKKDYLPRQFILALLNQYKNKTELKGVAGYEEEYNKAKNWINSYFGMIGMLIDRDEYKFINGMWTESKVKDLDKIVENYNKDPKRFMFWPWAVYVTAYNQYALLKTIKQFGDDHRYSDTDSEKCVNYQKHKWYIDAYNKNIEEKIKQVSKARDIAEYMFRPKTAPKDGSEGDEKILGLWEHEGTYKYFKTLGAKRYLYIDENDRIVLTVAGMNKIKSLEYLLKKSNIEYEKDNLNRFYYKSGNIEGLFNRFNNHLRIPPEESGKLTSIYFDKPCEGYITDYQGNTAYYHELSYIHMAPQEYDLSILSEYEMLSDYYGEMVF